MSHPDRFKRATAIAVALYASLCLTAALPAATVKLLDNPYGTTGGGEFRWQVMSGEVGHYPGAPLNPAFDTSPSTFTTFCVEYNEFIAFGDTYNATITTFASAGGVGGANAQGQDPLDPRTAYLFSSLYSGTLNGYALSGAARTASANALQIAIWWIEQEWAVGYTGAFGANAALANQFYNAANAAVAGPNPIWSGLGNVRVLHLTTLSGAPAQDQLVMVPLPPAVLSGAALLALQATRRMLRRRVVT